MICGKERTREEQNRELGVDIKARQTIRRDADAIVLRLVDRRSIVSSRSAHSILLSRSPEYAYLVTSSEHPSKVVKHAVSTARAPRGVLVVTQNPARGETGEENKRASDPRSIDRGFPWKPPDRWTGAIARRPSRRIRIQRDIRRASRDRTARSHGAIARRALII